MVPADTLIADPSYDSGVRVAGIDEAGRGPLAGPVLAAAVILDPRRPISGLADSKTLTADRRTELAAQIKAHALAWSVGQADHDEIDRINILQATFVAMQRAASGLSAILPPARMLVDGNRCPEFTCPADPVVKGDSRIAAISAASIIAKVERDRLLFQLHERYPVYGFDRHKGYPTKAHLAALAAHGVCPEHRRSFRPVRIAIAAAVPSQNQVQVNN